jgi:hypothetical protein
MVDRQAITFTPGVITALQFPLSKLRPDSNVTSACIKFEATGHRWNMAQGGQSRQTTVRAFVQHRASSAPEARPRCLIITQVNLVEIWRLKLSLTFKLSGQRTLWPGEQKKAMFTLGFSPELLSVGHCPSPQGTASSSRRIFHRCCKSSKRPRNGMRGALLLLLSRLSPVSRVGGKSLLEHHTTG